MYNNEENEHNIAPDTPIDEDNAIAETGTKSDEIAEACSENSEEHTEEHEEISGDESGEENEPIEFLPDTYSSTASERYKELRALGLTHEEAYLASSVKSGTSRMHDTRSHLSDSTPRAAGSQKTVMTRRELREAREIFAALDDSEIIRLYKKVTT